ncbi:MAG TPA: AtpZ/AtpI family protein [Candidatus Kapabacteria bacterium]|nr:AtpZ/AtpI family protein [Ignavibacteria bacterium]HRE57401.1 AtpZ/AtpI family protein [Candidatus Kapabacteria bacterium]HRK60775.1 AtpZ/AtpI family protein [Candidatus Kapabacteria bacterium]
MSSKDSVRANKVSERANVMRDFAPYLSLGAQMSGAVVVSGGIGWWLDTLFQTDPVFLIVMLLFGIISGMTMFIRAALGADKKVT